MQPAVSHPICDHCINEINAHQSMDQRYPPGGYQGYCYRCGQWGHMARNCGDSKKVVSDTTQHHDRENTRQVLTTSDRSLIQIAFPS